jgi:putative DNA primase/helicase
MDTLADYVRAGFALVPIPSGQKGPTTKGWNVRENVVTDENNSVGLTGNIGLAHAYSTPLTMALDIDDMVRAVPWLAARGIDVYALLEAEDAVQIVSGRPGRAKLLYSLPPGCNLRESISIKEVGLVDGNVRQITVIEFRCATRDGLTMQDVLPPSIHPDTGRPYRWGGKGTLRAIPMIPDRLLFVWQDELEKHLGSQVQPKASGTRQHEVEDTPRQRALVVEMLTHVSADCSYELYRNIVWAILSLGWKDAEDLAEQWCRTASHRFEDVDFYNVVNSHDPTRSPTIGTIYHHARQGGWNG